MHVPFSLSVSSIAFYIVCTYEGPWVGPYGSVPVGASCADAIVPLVLPLQAQYGFVPVGGNPADRIAFEVSQE